MELRLIKIDTNYCANLIFWFWWNVNNTVEITDGWVQPGIWCMSLLTYSFSKKHISPWSWFLDLSLAVLLCFVWLLLCVLVWAWVSPLFGTTLIFTTPEVPDFCLDPESELGRLELATLGLELLVDLGRTELSLDLKAEIVYPYVSP